MNPTVSFSDVVNWKDLTPGKYFYFKWNYLSGDDGQSVKLYVQLTTPGDGSHQSHIIYLGDNTSFGPVDIIIPGTEWSWDVPYNIPYGSICNFTIGVVANGALRGPDTFEVHTIIQQPITRSDFPRSLPYCFDATDHNCIDPIAPTPSGPASSATVSSSISIANIDATSSSRALFIIATQTIYNGIPPSTIIPTSLSNSQDSHSHTFSPGAKAGMAIGAGFSLLAFAVIGFFLYKYGKRRALEKDNTTEYSKGWTVFRNGKGGANEEPVVGGGKAEMSAESAVKDVGRNELDGIPAPAYVERFSSGANGEGHGGGNGAFVDSGEGGVRAELPGSPLWRDDIQAAPVATNGGEVEGISGEKVPQNVVDSDGSGGAHGTTGN